jgi:quercetin dioxygenase-like cupin family protein
MIVSNVSEVERRELQGPEVKNAAMKVVISPKEGWEGYVMRIFEFGKDGHSPRHIHPWPHINYIIKGNGKVHIDGKDYDIKEGSYAYVPPDVLHQFINTGEESLELMCIVPEIGHK